MIGHAETYEVPMRNTQPLPITCATSSPYGMTEHLASCDVSRDSLRAPHAP